jgi:predicted nuclease with TOPRIM domain
MSTPTDSDELTKVRALLEEFRATFDERVKRNEELLREIAKQTAAVGDTLQRTRNTRYQDLTLQFFNAHLSARFTIP